MSEEKTRATEGQAFARAAMVLRCVAEKPGASLGEIAKSTQLARSTVQRLVNALSAEGFLTKTFGQQGVYLGMELARLGAKVNLDARALLAPFMAELHAQIGDNIDLTTLDHGRVIVIEQIASNEDIRVISFVGKEHPIHCTANGKAHLAQLARAEALALLGDDLQAFTARTLTEKREVMAQVEAFAELGLFVDREEYGADACAVAITLPEIGGRPLALSIAMPSARFARRETEVKAALLAFRASVEAAFGRSL